MSAVDCYYHRCLGAIVCPSRYPFVGGNDHTRIVGIYRLDQDALDDDSFMGKRGDILVGGGRGEAPALRISMPEALLFWTHDDWEKFPGGETWTPALLAHAYWSMTRAYTFGDGYAALGWTPEVQIETWLAHHVLSFLIQQYPGDYAGSVGSEPLDEDGSICRLPTPDELA